MGQAKYELALGGIFSPSRYLEKLVISAYIEDGKIHIKATDENAYEQYIATVYPEGHVPIHQNAFFTKV